MLRFSCAAETFIPKHLRLLLGARAGEITAPPANWFLGFLCTAPWPSQVGACTELTGGRLVEHVEKPRKASVFPREKCARIFVYNSKMFTAARLIIERNWRPLQYSSVGEYLQPWQLVSEMEYYVAWKREEQDLDVTM